MGSGLAVVSVVFEAEVGLQRLQARSMARFVPPDLVTEIIVIDNSAAGLTTTDADRLRREYGPHQDQVRILRPSEICRVPGATGWRSQQVLKLQVAEQIAARRYVVLDAKNHFVAPLERSFVEAPDGRARVNVYAYETHPLRPSLEHVLRYLGLDPREHVGRFTATVTPFVLDVDLVRALIADVERRSGRPFAQEFVAKELTEFFLYTAWVLATGRSLEEVFDVHQVFCPVVWPKRADIDGVEAAVRRSQEEGAPVFTVHRRALAHLAPAAVTRLAKFWWGRGLFSDVEEAEEFVADFRRDFDREERAQRRRELPTRIAAVPRKVRRRVVGALRRRSEGS